MAKNLRKGLSLFLAVLMCVSLFSTSTMAVEPLSDDTVWYGDEWEVSVTPSDDSYTFTTVTDTQEDDAPKYYYYETSNHTIKKEVTGGGAVHIIPMVDTLQVSGTWTPDGPYEYGKSNYDIMYCCDAETDSEGGEYFKRLNLEDSEYYTDEEAKQIRAILSNAYPYVTVEEMKAFLKGAGFEYADQLDRSEMISAIQAAIWSISNQGSGDSYVYNKTASTSQKLGWGGYMHDFTPEITNFNPNSFSRYNEFDDV